MADIILLLAEESVFTPLVFGDSNAVWPREWWARQFLVLFIFTGIGAAIMYLSFAGFNYLFFFDPSVMKDKRVLPNQIRLEILYTLESIPGVTFLTTIVFMLEIHGYSMLYDSVDEYGWPYFFLSIILFFFFTDMLIYFIHRGLHEIKFAYAYIHKPHHKWVITSPFASHAFHPLDGFLQGIPYHLFAFFFPFHKYLYLVMFIIVQLWTVSIHDGIYMVPKSMERVINGALHHSYHHVFFTCNYGQYFTLWDRLFGTHRDVDELELKNSKTA